MGDRFRAASPHPSDAPRGDATATTRSLFRRAHPGRYFGGLWFKVFSERGPC